MDGAKDSLCVGLVQALVARQPNGAALASKKVVAFCQVMKNKSRKAYDFLRANGFGYAVRSLQRIARNQRTTTDLIFHIEPDQIKSRANAYITKCGEDTVYHLAVDATKVVKLMEICTAFGFVVGGAAPKHVLDVGRTEEDAESWLLSEIVLSAQPCPANDDQESM